ncbi:DUF2141 domain-containing protein [Desulfolutivibrio sulfoxidireducens]|uniref:DUF2141 domain-containing protein n=1 Tax=Desulfolutivibrio sulfoxidireducens TaxID=2773299 RepID=UPI00159E6C16|nr:DUF2141 domain-containing protein [Desulfolutivibrio sulfoxidireducens]QLA20790.1 DUF2141 domain-containing protein [Desulfolutivibrio sulfoxidireducens]
MRLAACLLIVLMIGVPAWGSDSTGNLTVTMEGFQNDTGLAMVSVFADAAGFPYDTSKAVRREKVAIKDRKAVVTFAALPFGSYAVAMFHDNDLSGVLEKNIFGIPKKGYGLSNNPAGSPLFDTSGITLDTPDQAIAITLKY